MFSNKPVIGVVFGGKSSEHEVSIKSAKTIYNALRFSSNKERYIAVSYTHLTLPTKRIV